MSSCFFQRSGTVPICNFSTQHRRAVRAALDNVKPVFIFKTFRGFVQTTQDED